MSQSEFPYDFADRSVRDALKQESNLREFLLDAIPDIAKDLDFNRVEQIEREFLTEDWRGRESDFKRSAYRNVVHSAAATSFLYGPLIIGCFLFIRALGAQRDSPDSAVCHAPDRSAPGQLFRAVYRASRLQHCALR